MIQAEYSETNELNRGMSYLEPFEELLARGANNLARKLGSSGMVV